MNFLKSSFLILLFSATFGQTSAQCTIEIFLFNKKSDSSDYTNFIPTVENLEPTAFINDQEILTYSFKIFKAKVKTNAKRKRRTHIIKTSVNLTDRISNMDLQNIGGRKFAIVLDKKIIYYGYLISTLSSVVPASGIYANIYENEFEIIYLPNKTLKQNDPRENKNIFDCLKTKNRFTFSKK